MTRDHDMKRAIRARMKVTGERYTVAHSALVAPSASRALASEGAQSQGGTMAAVHSDLLEELDERGFAVLRSFATLDEVVRMTAVVDEVVSTTLAEKQEEDRQRRAAGETGWVNVWHPGEEGVIFGRLTDRPDVAWILEHQGLVEVAAMANGAGSTLRIVGALATMPGYGHQGLHPDRDGLAPPIGSWDATGLVFALSPSRADTGTFRAVPGSHRTPPQFADRMGSAMPPHPDEVRIETEPGDVLVYSAHLWKSATFNGGVEPCKSLLVG